MLSNLSLLRVYTSSWSYVITLPLLVVNVMIVLVPIKDFLITNLLVVSLLVLFDIVVSYLINIRLVTCILSKQYRIKFVGKRQILGENEIDSKLIK